MTGTPGSDLVFINEEFHTERIPPRLYDTALADGWRHFGTHFFRYSLGIYSDEIRRVIPLRIRLSDFELSKSQRRLLRKNSDLTCSICPIEISDEIERLFETHKVRFRSDVPDSIYDFLSMDAAATPTQGFQVEVRQDSRLLAVSFFDVGSTTVSSIYAIFDLEESERSLGTFTLLKEIEFAAAEGKEFLYHGYAYEGESFYDYKKRFSSLEAFDWQGKWTGY